MHNYARKADNFYEIKRDWVGPERAYPLRMTAFTNQYTPTSLDPSILTPRIIRSNQATAVTGTGNLIFRRFDNLEVLPTGTALSGSGLILSTIAGSGSTGVTTIVGTGGVQVQTSSGTTAVTSVVSASGSIRWHGGYILGELIDPSVFVSEKATLSGASLSAMNIEKIARVGADTLGVGMRLSQNVTLSFPVNTVTPYRILSSEDGLNWSELAPSVTPVNGRVSFSTPHFSLFAAVSTVAPLPPSCTISASNTTPMNGTPITLSWSASNTQSISLAGFGAQMANGNLSVTPANDTGTTYTLSLVGAGNTSGSCQVTVTTQ